MSFLSRSDLRALEWSINEICDNVLNHSQSTIGGIFQLNVRKKSKEVEFVVSDAGVGIPRTLESLSKGKWTDEFALEQSIKQGVTRDPEIGQGNGLFGTYQIAALSGGTFHINSGLAHLVSTRGGMLQVRRDELGFYGTCVVCAIGTSHPALLESALSFKGSQYKMIDSIEMNYEDSDDSVILELSKESTSFGSRRAGLEVRNKIQNILSYGEYSSLTIDMSGISIMSSSFADELFAKLAVKIGIEKFLDIIVLKNASTLHKQLIEKAISQRLSI